MPADKDLKRLIRARMARTGESYSTARLHTLARPARQGRSAGREGDRMQRTRFETGIEDGRRLVTALDVPSDYEHSLIHGLEFGVAFSADEADTERKRFVWEYPADAPGWPDAARNWVADGPGMLDQKHGVRPADWEAGLAWIAGILDGIEADWFLIGSAALAVRGMDVRPGGIDVVLDEAGAGRLGPHVGTGVLRPVIDSGGWEVATRSGLLFRGCIISIVGGMHDQRVAPAMGLGGPRGPRGRHMAGPQPPRPAPGRDAPPGPSHVPQRSRPRHPRPQRPPTRTRLGARPVDMGQGVVRWPGCEIS